MKCGRENKRSIPLSWWVWALVGWCSAGCGTIYLPPPDERPKTTASSESQHAEESLASDGGEHHSTPEASPTESTLAPETSTTELHRPQNPDLPPQLAWHKRFGSELVDGGKMAHAERDLLGNIYVIGRFHGTMQIGSCRSTAKGGQDIFVARIDTNGTCAWLKTWGSPQDDEGRGIAIDSQGDIYIIGQFAGSMVMDRHTLTPKSKQGGDGLIARLDPAGNVRWLRQITEEVSSYSAQQSFFFSHTHIAFHPDGHLLVAGSKEQHFHDSGGSQKIGVFLHAYETDGKEIWKRGWDGAHEEQIRGMAVSPQGQIGLIGYTHRGNTIETFVAFRSYVVLLDDQGKLLWGRRLPEQSYEKTSQYLAFDPKSNLILFGEGNGKSLEKDVPYSNTPLGFLAKLDTAGKILWIKDFTSSHSIQFSGLGLDAFGNPFVAGAFRKDATLGSQTVTTPEVGPNYGAALFLCKFNDEGDLQWHKTYPTLLNTTAERRTRILPALSRLGGVLWLSPFEGYLSLQTDHFLYSVPSIGPYTQTHSAFFFAHLQTDGSTNWSNASGNGYSQWIPQSLQRDTQGNLYKLGTFQGRIPLFLQTRSSKLLGVPRMALLKYAPNGQQLWARTFPTSGADGSPLHLAVSGGYLYVVGHLTNDLTIEGVTLSVPKETQTLFAAQFSLEGRLLWLKSFGSSSGQRITAITADPQGNLFLAGPVNAGLRIGSYTPALEISQSAAYIAKISPEGTVAWLRVAQGEAVSIREKYCTIESIQADAQGDIYLNGQAYVSALHLDGLVLTPQASRRSPIGFVSKLSRDGKALWHRSYWSPSNTYASPSRLALHGQGLYLAGSYSGYASFGENTLPSHAHAGFLARLDTQGIPRWARTITTEETYPRSAIHALVSSPDGGVYLAGRFWKQIQFSSRFGLTPPVQVQDEPNTAQHGFLVRYTPQGDAVWALAFDHPRIHNHSIDLSSMVTDHTGRITLMGSVVSLQPYSYTPDHALQIDQTVLPFGTNNTDFLLSFVHSSP